MTTETNTEVTVTPTDVHPLTKVYEVRGQYVLGQKGQPAPRGGVLEDTIEGLARDWVQRGGPEQWLNYPPWLMALIIAKGERVKKAEAAVERLVAKLERERARKGL